jgi:hypothetical protein
LCLRGGGVEDFEGLTVINEDDPPAMPLDGIGIPSDNESLFSWTNSSDTTYIKILRREDQFPEAQDEGGSEVVFEDAVSGDSQGSYTDTGLVNQRLYYYGIFAKNALNLWSEGASVEVTPLDIVTPNPVSQLTVDASGYDSELILTWVESESVDASGHKILRKVGSYAEDEGAGVTVLVPTTNYFKDTGLSNAETYYYSVLSQDDDGLLSDPVFGSGSPEDHTPPLPVTALTAVQVESGIQLNWELPTYDYETVIIVRSQTEIPTTVDGGESLTSGNMNGYLDTTVGSGILYYYSVFARDEVPNGPPAST